jgi:hypothetical protein
VDPDEEKGKHFLIGLSGFHATERDARDEAMRHARNEFARYTGVEVSELDQISREVFGSSSGILDPTVSGKTQTTQEANALVSRVKASSFYFETLKGQCRGSDLGLSYQYWVLAEVPIEEYQKVQDWKAKREAAKEAEKAAERTRMGEEIERMSASHRAAVVEADTLIAKADLIGALTVLQGNWSWLYDGGKAVEAQGLSTSGIERLHALQREVPAAIERVRAALQIDPGRGGGVMVASGSEETAVEVPVWTWARRADQVFPAPNIPLLLRESGGSAVLARARSDPKGEARFLLTGLKPGSYEVAVDPTGPALAALDTSIRTAIAATGATLSVRAYSPDLAGAAKAGVHQLFAGPSVKPLPVKKVSMGPVRYQGTRFGSEFGKRLETHIVQELSRISDIQIIPPPKTRGLDELASASKARGITTTDRPVPMNSPAMQAQLDGADGTLEVTYALEGRKVSVDFQITQAGTGALLAAAGASVDQRLIPDGLQFDPSTSRIDLAPISTGKPGEIRLELTTARGDGVTFSQGEKIAYYVSSNRDAYLLLLYQDAENHLIQIYPNSRSGKGFHSAGEFMEIPDQTASFDFTITPPFGVEQVWAFAATEPFPTLQGKGLSNGLTVLQQGLTEVASQLRAHGKKPGMSYGEANVVVTTVKE